MDIERHKRNDRPSLEGLLLQLKRMLHKKIF
jgi:hypothetical protein